MVGGKAVVALNTGIILHHLTLSLRITFKLSPGKVERGGRGGAREVKRVFGGSRRADIMTTLCFRAAVSSPSTILSGLSQPRVPVSALSLHLSPRVHPCICSFCLSRQC